MMSLGFPVHIMVSTHSGLSPGNAPNPIKWHGWPPVTPAGEFGVQATKGTTGMLRTTKTVTRREHFASENFSEFEFKIKNIMTAVVQTTYSDLLLLSCKLPQVLKKCHCLVTATLKANLGDTA